MPPWHENGNAGAGWLLRSRRRSRAHRRVCADRATRSGRSAPSGRRREAGRLRWAYDCEIQRRRVGVPIRGRSMASQVLLGRLHRRDGMGRLMLRFRELLDVVLQRVELAPETIDFLVLRGALRGVARGRRIEATPQRSQRRRTKPSGAHRCPPHQALIPGEITAATPAVLRAEFSRGPVRTPRRTHRALAFPPGPTYSASALPLSASVYLPRTALQNPWTAHVRTSGAAARHMMRPWHQNLKLLYRLPP